jgi:quinolinate synthase
MGLNIIDEMKRRGVEKDIKLWDGTCYVHEEYDPDMIDYIRGEFDDVKVLAHPECSPGVLHHSDFVGSTAQLLKFMETSESDAFLMLTECGLSARLQVEMPEKNFVGSCSVCKYMKANTLENVLDCLKNPRPENTIELTQKDIDGSRRCIDAMFHYAEKMK